MAKPTIHRIKKITMLMIAAAVSSGLLRRKSGNMRRPWSGRGLNIAREHCRPEAEYSQYGNKMRNIAGRLIFVGLSKSYSEMLVAGGGIEPPTLGL